MAAERERYERSRVRSPQATTRGALAQAVGLTDERSEQPRSIHFAQLPTGSFFYGGGTGTL